MPADRITTERLLEHADFVRRLARELAGEPSLAEDVSQEVWARALNRPPRSGARIRAWLAEVTRNVVRQLRRSDARRQHRERAVAARSPHPGPDAIAERAAVVRLIAQIVEGLEEPYRTAIFLRFYEGLSPREIAERVGLNASTVRSHLRRGIAQVRGELDRAAGGREGWLGALVIGAFESKTAANAALALGGGVLVKAKIGLVAVFGLLIAGLVYWAAEDALAPLEPSSSQSEVIFEAQESGELAAAEVAAAEVAAAEVAAATQLESVSSASKKQETESFATRIVGRCVDASGDPVPNATISWDPAARNSAPEGLRRSRTNPAGRFDWSVSIEPGRVERKVHFVVEAAGKRRYQGHCWAPAATTIWLRDIVLLESGGAVTGRVVDSRGEPIEGAQVIARAKARGRGPFYSAHEVEHVLGPGGSRFRPEDYPVRTSGSGTFRIDALTPGVFHIWATSEGMTYAATKLSLRSEQTVDAGTLRLEPIPEEHWITGTILDPEGRPVQEAPVLCFRRLPDGQDRMGGTSTDGDGRFRIRTFPDGIEKLQVFDPKRNRWSPIRRESAPAGADLTLRFEPLRQVALEIVGPDGEAVRPYSISCERPTDDVLRWRALTSWSPHEHRDEAPTIGVPDDIPIRLHVRASGYEDLYTPVRPGSEIPDTLRLVLEGVPAVRGRVLAGRQPVGNAWVYLLPLAEPDEQGDPPVVWIAGFVTRARVRTSGYRSSRTDDEGRFALRHFEAGRAVVVAEAVGHARSEPLELELGADDPPQDLELGLGTGGSLSGQVTTIDGSDPTGLVVAISDDLGLVQSTRVAPGGSYGFEHLAPGEYRIDFNERDVKWAMAEQKQLPDERALDLEPNLVVTKGEETRYDLIWKPELRYTLEGYLGVAGVSPLGWSARLLAQSRSTPEVDTSWVELDSAGRFRLGAAWPGKYRLLVARKDDSTSWEIRDEVELTSARSYWNLEIGTGTVRGTTRLLESTPRQVAIYWDSTVKIEVRSQLESNDSFSLIAPSGRSSLLALGYTQSIVIEPDQVLELQLIDPRMR